MNKTLIGGRALIAYGSNRNTTDIDYLIFDKFNKSMFIKDDKENTDYLNANGFDFFKEIWEIEKDNHIASPQSLLELKAYALVMHYQNFNLHKANDAEYDIKFLVIKFNLKELKIVNKYLAPSEIKEVMKIINSVKS